MNLLLGLVKIWPWNDKVDEVRKSIRFMYVETLHNRVQQFAFEVDFQWRPTRMKDSKNEKRQKRIGISEFSTSKNRRGDIPVNLQNSSERLDK